MNPTGGCRCTTWDHVNDVVKTTKKKKRRKKKKKESPKIQQNFTPPITMSPLESNRHDDAT